MTDDPNDCRDCQQWPCICDDWDDEDAEPQQMVCNGTCDSCDCHPSVWHSEVKP